MSTHVHNGTSRTIKQSDTCGGISYGVHYKLLLERIVLGNVRELNRCK